MDIKYDKIGTGYNSTRKADPYLTEKLIYYLHPEKDKLYLDIGCGTGNYTIALAEYGINIFGVDPSDQMLNEARSRNRDIKWLKGTAEELPVVNEVLDGAIATLTIHHWTNLQASFSEINRVLSGNGRLVLFTSTPEQMKGYWLNHYFPEMLKASIIQMPSLSAIQTALRHTKLEIERVEPYYIQDNLQDHFLYAGKNNPTLYFDETIRNGISSFTSLSHSDEVQRGLKQLQTDIEGGAFDKIKDEYENDLGDYMFLTLKKAVD